MEMFSLHQRMCHLQSTTRCQSVLPWWAWHVICMHMSMCKVFNWKVQPHKQCICLHLFKLIEALFGWAHGGLSGTWKPGKADESWFSLEECILADKNVTFNHPQILSFLPSFLPFLPILLLLFFWFLFRNILRGRNSQSSLVLLSWFYRLIIYAFGVRGEFSGVR